MSLSLSSSTVEAIVVEALDFAAESGGTDLKDVRRAVKEALQSGKLEVRYA